MLSAREILELCNDQEFKLGALSLIESPRFSDWLHRDCLKAPIEPKFMVERYEEGPPAEAVKVTVGVTGQMLVGEVLEVSKKEPQIVYPGEMVLAWVDLDFVNCAWSGEFSYTFSLTFDAIASGLKFIGASRNPSGKIAVVFQNATFGHAIELVLGVPLVEVRFSRLETSYPLKVRKDFEYFEIGVVDNTITDLRLRGRQDNSLTKSLRVKETKSRGPSKRR